MPENKTAKKAPFSWTQPCCPEDWVDLKLKIGRQGNVPEQPVYFCCFCRKQIEGTPYGLRVNPGSVPYPTIRKDQE